MLAAPKSLRNLAISIVLQEFDPNSALSRRAFLQTGLRATPNPCLIVLAAVIAARKRPVPFRTRKLSSPAPMVLPWERGGRVGRSRTKLIEGSHVDENPCEPFVFPSLRPLTPNPASPSPHTASGYLPPWFGLNQCLPQIGISRVPRHPGRYRLR